MNVPRTSDEDGPTDARLDSGIDSYTTGWQLDEREIERWYGRRGMTLLLRGTGVGGNTADRAAPVLVGLFLLTMLLVVPMLTTADIVATMAVAVGVLLATWIGGNLGRRRSAFARIHHIGLFEAVAFVAAPALAVAASPTSSDVADVFAIGARELQLLVAAGVAVWQFGLLVGVFLIVMLGLVSLVSWLLREFWRSLGETGSALSVTLPVMLGVVFFFFINPGVWSTMGRLPAWSYLQVMALLLLLAVAFLSSRRQFDLPALTRFEDEAALRAALADTPAADAPVLPATPMTCPLTRRQRINATIVAVMSRLVVALVIALAVFTFFVVLGAIAIDATAITRWTGTQPHIVAQVHALGTRPYLLTWEGLRVAGFLAMFSAFNYSMASVTDARLRHGAAGTVNDVISQACALRLVLLARAGRLGE